MQNEWKNLWNKRSGELDRIDSGELTYDALYGQYLETKQNLWPAENLWGGGETA